MAGDWGAVKEEVVTGDCSIVESDPSVSINLNDIFKFSVDDNVDGIPQCCLETDLHPDCSFFHQFEMITVREIGCEINDVKCEAVVDILFPGNPVTRILSQFPHAVEEGEITSHARAPSPKAGSVRFIGHLIPVNVHGDKVHEVMLKFKGVLYALSVHGIVIHQSDDQSFRSLTQEEVG